MAKATKESNSTNPKPSSSHPPYSQMICDAIVALKERTGSSQYAISKFIEEKHKANLPPNFKKTLLSQLKRLVAAEKLVKIKNSFKISTSSSAPAAVKPKPKPKATAATKLKPAAAAKPKKAALAKPKPKPKQRPVKAAKSATKASPGKKMKMVKAKKPKSIKSPVKKAVAVKKVKKAAN
ncbi:histone H1.2-like protein [Cinnamomum micranthum f. kanehirae]|uniref:Histone H1.2-like protein n=1 Tax=Cinnamomum micranthum f. kanehirae TaxID=337451 RepID=A0A3S3MWN8_9MAGN|nr:histone H1.2-like protein [Cinnamomum micranthum f. kanehirae]